jgi:DNA-binding LacI/PurR family transcriptional regulator
MPAAPDSPRHVRLADLARAAGVSISTVVRSLAGRPDVSAATRRRVCRLAIRLGYTPNALARSLVSQRSRTLGLLVNDCTNPFYAVLIEAIQQVAAKHGYAVVLGTSGERAEREVESLRVLLERRVDGLLITPVGREAAHLRRLPQGRPPFVLMSRHLAGVAADLVATDHRLAGLTATRHLVRAHGHRVIAHLTADDRVSSVRELAEGVLAGLQEAGLALEPRCRIPATPDLEGGFAAGRRLARLQSRPRALVAFNDLQAIGAMRALEEAGLHVPDDMAIIGNNDVAFARFAPVPLTTVVHPVAELGQVAVDRLISRIEGGARRPESILLRPELRVRRSCGCTGTEADGPSA